MNKENAPRQRIISLDEARRAFGEQIKLFPDLMDEVCRLGTTPGTINALLTEIIEEVSYSPQQEMDVQRMRDILNAPDEHASPDELSEWRTQLWDAHKHRY